MSYVSDYDCYEEDYKMVSDFEDEMESKGFKFITNFRVKYESVYRKACEIHDISFSIENECHNFSGIRIDDGTNLKAFYVDIEINGLSDFWRTFETLQKEMELSC